jgi:hypothetical protein
MPVAFDPGAGRRTRRMMDGSEPAEVITMAATKRWTVDIYIDEHEEQRRTRAEARLHTDQGTEVRGIGSAHRNPSDREVPEIGDELAASRALADLARTLREAAAGDIEQVTHEPVRLSS